MCRPFNQTPQIPHFHPHPQQTLRQLPLYQMHLYQVQGIIQHPSSGLLGAIYLPEIQLSG